MGEEGARGPSPAMVAWSRHEAARKLKWKGAGVERGCFYCGATGDDGHSFSACPDMGDKRKELLAEFDAAMNEAVATPPPKRT